MTFITDKQTLSDLNLLGKYKVGSMFNLFNRVKTRGGELLLEELFRSPLTDAAAINERSAQIRYLAQLKLDLELNADHAEMASGYLTEQRPGNRLVSLLGSCKGKLQEMLYRSPAYFDKQRHIHAVQEVMLAASKLLTQLRKRQGSGNPCHNMQQRLAAILDTPALRQLKAKYPYTVQQTAECQFLFLNQCRAELEELMNLLSRFDVLISVAEVAATKKLCYAMAEPRGGIFEARSLRHPSLGDAIGNTLTLTRDSNVLFLTGANMAGKSTWMKTLGVSYYLAHMGFPVAADEMRFSVMEGIFTSINVPDDISLGWSHFYAEVMRVKKVAEEVSSGKKLFILFDELFKGTNVKDAYDATLAVTHKLAEYRRCLFVISTHIIEVGDALRTTPNILFRYMPTVMDGPVPRYTYSMAEGITSDRQGMIIIANEGILEMLKPNPTP